ncbi:cytochrome P450 [Trichoderma evansii]
MRLDNLAAQSLHPITVTALLLSIFLYPLYRVAAWLADYAHQLKLKRARIDAPVVNLGADVDYAAATQRYMRDFKGILQEGYDKYKHRAFQVWGIDGYIAILSPNYVEEMSALGTDVLDFHAASQRRIIGDYEWLKITDALGAHTVLHDVTRQIGAMLPGIHNEVEHVLATEFPPCKDWTRLAVWPKMYRTMALVVSYMIGGTQLSRDEEWLRTMMQFVDNIFVGGWELKTYSLLLRPIVARGLVPGIRRVWRHQADARKILVPIIQQRRIAEAQALAESEKYSKPNDLIQWMTDNGAKANPPRTDERVSDMCLVIAFAALHAATVTVTNIVFDLAARPEYVEPLREEYRLAKQKYEKGWLEKQALLVSSLSKLDSFIKESQRLNPVTLTSFSRVVRKPVTLSSGLHLPKDTHILVPAAMISLDPEHYPSPFEFQGFRFHEKRLGSSEESQYKDQFTTTSPRQMHFGFGRQACPGRFFASAAIKCIIIHLLEDFEIKLVNDKGRPENTIKGAMSVTSESLEAMFLRQEK